MVTPGLSPTETLTRRVNHTRTEARIDAVRLRAGRAPRQLTFGEAA